MHNSYITDILNAWPKVQAGEHQGETTMADILETIKEKCIRGKRVELIEEVKRALAEGIDAKTVMNDALIPAMSVVGEKYSSGEFFLPQMMLARVR